MCASWHTDRYIGSLFRVDGPVPCPTLMAHSEEAQQHYQQRGRDALLLLHLQVPQRLRKVKMVEKIDNICVHAILLAKNVVYLVNIF